MTSTVAMRAVPSLMLAASGLCSCSSAPRLLEPPCSSPAPITGEWDRRAPGYMVHLFPQPDPVAHARAFVERHGLNTAYIAKDFFTVDQMSPEVLAELRCEKLVKVVRRNKYLGYVLTAT
jgi:hypothetical protein